MKKYYPVIVFAVLVLITMIFSVTGVINETIGVCISLGLVTILNLVVAIIAFKHDIKILGCLMIIFMIAGAVLLALNIYSITQKKENTNDFQISVKISESPKTKLFANDSKNYYTYNLNSINVTMGNTNNIYSLEEAIQQNKIKLDDILEASIPNDNTEGYKIYYHRTTNLINNSYSIVLCENNNDVIFSTFNYIYSEDICKN